MYKNGDTIVIGDEQELVKYIKDQFANGATLIIQTSNGELRTIKVRKL
jgi:hypothetical protein